MALARRARRILILGGSGFVGRRLVHALAELGYSSRVPTRSRARSRRLLVTPETEVVQADVHDPATLQRLLRDCDAVVNLIGILNERGHDGSGFQHAHVALVEKLVRACRESGVTRVLHMSALKADAERAPSLYLRTKGQAERILSAASDVLRYAVLRPSVIFGPEDSFLNRFARLLRRLPVLPLACPDARFAPVFVGDVAAALVKALREERTGVYELCGPDIYTLEEIVRLVQAHLGLRRVIWPLPEPLAKLEAWVGEYVPGKPFSIDNLASLSVPSVCTGEADQLSLAGASLPTLLPACLGTAGAQRQMGRLRRRARR
jgi:uncharacterized protein YbjT (DUF2867 family)